MPAKTVYKYSGNPEATVVIPSIDGNRSGNVRKLINSLKKQSYKNIEIIVSINETPNGHARNVGIEKASGTSCYYIFFDDDITLGHTRILEFIIKILKKYPEIGLAGVSQLAPPASGLLSEWLNYDLARNSFYVTDKITDTDMVTHAGLGCRKEIWERIGGENDRLITGTDTDLRERLRKKGYRVAVVPYTFVFHPVETNLITIFKRAVIHGKYQVQYRQIHGYHKKWWHPFHKVDSVNMLILQIIRELIFLGPHMFYANRKIKTGFRPVNAVFRFFMAISYSYNCYKFIKNNKKQ